jgi:hypothetical protein
LKIAVDVRDFSGGFCSITISALNGLFNEEFSGTNAYSTLFKVTEFITEVTVLLAPATS